MIAISSATIINYEIRSGSGKCGNRRNVITTNVITAVPNRSNITEGNE